MTGGGDHVRRLARLADALTPPSVVADIDADLPGSLDVTLDTGGARRGGTPLATEGVITETPSRFASSGTASYTGAGNGRSRHELELTEGGAEDRAYAFEGSHRLSVSDRIAPALESPEGVRASLATLLPSPSLPDVGLEVESHTVEEGFRAGSRILDIDYSVGVDPGDVGDGCTLPGVEEASVSVTRGSRTEVSWDVDLRDHLGLFTDLLADTGYRDADAVRRVRRDADLRQTVEWSLGRGAPARMEYTTENVEGYLERLRDEGVRTPDGASVELDADTTGQGATFSLDLSTDPSASEGGAGWTPLLPLPLAVAAGYLP